MILVDLLEYFQTYNWSLYLQLLLKSYIIFLLNFTINYYKSLGNQKRSKIQVDYFEEKSIHLKYLSDPATESTIFWGQMPPARYPKGPHMLAKATSPLQKIQEGAIPFSLSISFFKNKGMHKK